MPAASDPHGIRLIEGRNHEGKRDCVDDVRLGCGTVPRTHRVRQLIWLGVDLSKRVNCGCVCIGNVRIGKRGGSFNVGNIGKRFDGFGKHSGQVVYERSLINSFSKHIGYVGFGNRIEGFGFDSF